MEVEEIHAQNCNKFPRVSNGRNEGNKIGQEVGDRDHYPDDEDDGEALRMSTATTCGGSDPNKLRGWHNSSRIIRVSRASGGKDRHSKVWTSKGLRDRRVRLSVSTAIQFYDLQDRLGYDQPSKAVEWLIKAAADAISELPSLNSANFPDTPKQLSNEKRTREGFDSAEMEVDANGNINQHISLSKSASSTSETSKGSGLSLSRSEIRVNRVKARERARERAAKEKENESRITHHQNLNPISQNSSFTDLLTGCTSPTGSGPQNAATGGGGEPNLFHNYFGSGLRAHNFAGQIHMGNSNSLLGENHPELQHFSFVPDHLITAATSQPGGGNEYNLNFSISSGGLAGYNRGTLQSNSSPSLLPHLQRFSSPPIDGPNLPFFIGAGAPTTMENHHHQHHPHHPHQFPAGFDGRLQLCYGDGSRHSDHKGKGKN